MSSDTLHIPWIEHPNPTSMIGSARTAGECTAQGEPPATVSFKRTGHVYGRLDVESRVWLCAPSAVRKSDRAALRMTLNAFLYGLGARQHYSFNCLVKNTLFFVGFRPVASMKWRWYELPFDHWVPVMAGEHSTRLAQIMFERGDQPVFEQPTT